MQPPFVPAVNTDSVFLELSLAMKTSTKKMTTKMMKMTKTMKMMKTKTKMMTKKMKIQIVDLGSSKAAVCKDQVVPVVEWPELLLAPKP